MRRSSVRPWVAIVFVVSGVALWTSNASADESECRRAVPRNVELSAHLARVVQRMQDRSETFRTQCDRIAAASNLTVEVRVQVRTSGASICRARTIITRRGGQLHAAVQLPTGADQMELLAHEFEHILEQIEGLDVRRLARISGSGVWEVERELFESVRAQRAGRAVVRELFRRGGSD